MKKQYTNFEDIDRQLEILKLEREIQMRKMMDKAEDTVSVVSPANLVKTGAMSLATGLRGSSGLKSIIITALVRFIMRKLANRR